MRYKRITACNETDGETQIDCAYRENGVCTKCSDECTHFCEFFITECIKRLSNFENLVEEWLSPFYSTGRGVQLYRKRTGVRKYLEGVV